MHPCANCGARVLRESKLCQRCDRARRRIEMSEKPLRLRHGFANRPEFYIWSSMRRRCTNPKAQQYKDYGGRGIRVCERWNLFDNFIADMGPRPKGKYPSGRAKYTIERKDNDGDYSPKNCVWATYKQQSYNRQRQRLVRFRGKTRSLASWVDDLGLNYKIVHQRLARGWTVSQAFRGYR
jgi:hypothetical protein